MVYYIWISLSWRQKLKGLDVLALDLLVKIICKHYPCGGDQKKYKKGVQCQTPGAPPAFVLGTAGCIWAPLLFFLSTAFFLERWKKEELNPLEVNVGYA